MSSGWSHGRGGPPQESRLGEVGSIEAQRGLFGRTDPQAWNRSREALEDESSKKNGDLASGKLT